MAYLAVKCDHCHDSGHVPGVDAKAMIELIDWYVANFYNTDTGTFEGKLAVCGADDAEFRQASGGAIHE